MVRKHRQTLSHCLKVRGPWQRGWPPVPSPQTLTWMLPVLLFIWGRQVKNQEGRVRKCPLEKEKMGSVLTTQETPLGTDSPRTQLVPPAEARTGVSPGSAGVQTEPQAIANVHKEANRSQHTVGPKRHWMPTKP